jgi:hypothetical protein
MFDTISNQTAASKTYVTSDLSGNMDKAMSLGG